MRRSLLSMLVIALTACGSAPSPSAQAASASPATSGMPAATPSAGGAGAAITGEIAYVAGDDPQIFLLDLATGASRQLTELTEEHARLTSHGPLAPALSCAFGPSGLTWSPDGSALAFAYGGCESVVYVTDLDGRLTRIGDGRGPTWTPDGTRLLFTPNTPFCPDVQLCGEAPFPGAWNLLVADLRTGEAPRPLSLHEATTNAAQPRYSPDGTLIAYQGRLPEPANDPELFGAAYVMTADGSAPTVVARGAWPLGWLPDGRLVLVDERTSELRALDLQTTEVEPLVHTDGLATLSADGSLVLTTTFDGNAGTSGVRMMTIDGEVVAAIDSGWPLAWSPDSRAALVLDSTGAGALAVIGRDGAVLATHELAEDGGFSVEAAWRPGS